MTHTIPIGTPSTADTEPSSPAVPNAPVWQRAVQFHAVVTYAQTYQPSPRSRRTSTRRVSVGRTFSVRLASREDAPVVMMTRTGADCRAYRLNNGALYRELRSDAYPNHARPVPVTLEALIEEARRLANGFSDLEATVARVEGKLERLLCVDARLFERVPEPLLEVEDDRVRLRFDVPNHPHEYRHLYSVLECEAALGAVRRRLKLNGDHFPSVRVFRPEALRHPGHGVWLERYREAEIRAAVERVERGVGGLRRPERRAVLERVLAAA